MACTIDFWERRGERQTVWTPHCLDCGWIGSDTTMAEAEHEGEMHLRGEVQPWIMQPGMIPAWEGDPRSRR
ncbi:MAG: hypothetical protein JST59_12545 [Actinobacteria bacterium]|nr:hypothetical protein [Actinomycetota bacterium]